MLYRSINMPSTSILKTKFAALLFTAIVLLLSACGGGGGGGGGGNSGGGGDTGQINLQGLATKGPIAQGTVNVYLLNQDGTRGATPIASTTTDQNGQYQVSVPVLVSTPVAVVLTGGSYVDEATGNIVSLGQQDQLETYTYIPASGSLTAQITPLTTLAAGLARQHRTMDGQSLSNSISNAANEISNLFGVGDILNVSPPAISQVAISTPEQRNYALYLAGFSQLAQIKSISVFDIISEMADNLESNGILNDISHNISPADLVEATKQFIQDHSNLSLSNLSAQSATALSENEVDPAKIYSDSKTNLPPIANDATITTNEDTSVPGILEGSDANTSDTLTFSIFSNGSKGTAVVTDALNGNFTYTPNPNANGTDTFTYLVSDGKSTTTGTVTVTINPVYDPPTAEDVSVNTVENTATQSVMAGNDVDGNSLTYAKVSDPTHGKVTNFDAATGVFTYTPNQGFIGSDSFTYKANDGSMDSNPAVVTITINPVSNVPKASSLGVSTPEDSPITNGTLQASDNDSPVLTYSIVANGSHGTAVITDNHAGKFTYTPDLNYNGSDSFTFKANDGANDSNIATVTISITPVNDAPAAGDGSFTTDEDTPRTGTLSATDVDSPLFTYSIVRNGIKGTATITNPLTGAYTYIPNTNANGSDSFTFKASDGFLDSNIATIAVTITPVNDPPTGTVTVSGTPTQGQSLTVSNTLADADGLGTITYHWYADAVDTGATGTTYSLNESDVDKVISVRAAYTDGYGTDESVTSDNVGPVANVNDPPTGTVTVSGTPTQGRTLTVSDTLADADGLGIISYQWKADGSNISGASGKSYLLTNAEVGKTITVVASYTDGHGHNESVTSNSRGPVTNVNDSPSGTVTVSGTPTQGHTLTASNTLNDPDGLGTITYHWQAGGSDITGATGSTYTLTESDVGKVFSVRATYIDGHGTDESVTSNNSLGPVANVNDSPTGNVTMSGTPTQGETLTVSDTLADADGLGTITYHWYADAVDTGATGSSYLLTETDVGKVFSVRATYTDGHGTNETVASNSLGPVANVNDPPTGIVTISGTATQGETLTASNNLADADGLGTINYQWKAGGSDIGGATGSTYVLTEAEVGQTITVVASYTDGHGTAEQKSSTATAAVANVNDPPTGTVTIDNTTPSQGDTLTASNNLVDPDGGIPGTISYQWKAAGGNIGTGSSYGPLTQAEVGKTITVVASYTDGHGTPNRCPRHRLPR